MITNEDLDFYNKNGFLIVKSFLKKEKIDELDRNFDILRKKLADHAGIAYGDYQKEISQVRDIWHFDQKFKELILEEEIAQTVPLFFEDSSCRLLHDHIIDKPLGNNAVVPWHQDYTYWPTDKPNGLSFWLPFDDLDEHSGVLEVIPGSHLWGEEKPIDFINDQKHFVQSKVEYLTVEKGDLVVLHALSWHRTSENIKVKIRRAYISLWIPANSRYAPDHANWHPVNDNVTVQKNEILNDDWFPVLGSGNRSFQENEYLDNSYTLNLNVITMFNASKIARNFLLQELQVEGDIWFYLYDPVNRSNATKQLISKYSIHEDIYEELNEMLLSMAINGLAYQDHRARNVYNNSYVKFKSIFENEIK